MKAEKLSKRLDKVVEYILKYQTKPVRLADIGSDHAYLPVHLAINGQLEYAVAGEVAQGPFQSSEAEVSNHNLNHIIQVRLGDGLAVIQRMDRINTISICGMGGVLIRDILKEGRHQVENGKLLILQPNAGVEQLRSWLNQNKFVLLDETILSDNHRIYDILVAIRHEDNENFEPLTEEEVLFGPINLKEKSEVFQEKWKFELESSQKVLESVLSSKRNQEDKVAELKAKIRLIEEVLNNDD